MTENRNIPVPWYRQLHWQVLAAMVLGVATGLLGGETAASWVGWLGTLFMRLLRMVIIPLVVVSIVSGIATVGGGRRPRAAVRQDPGVLRAVERPGDPGRPRPRQPHPPGTGGRPRGGRREGASGAGDPGVPGGAASRHRPAELPRRRGRGGHAGGDLLLDPAGSSDRQPAFPAPGGSVRLLQGGVRGDDGPDERHHPLPAARRLRSDDRGGGKVRPRRLRNPWQSTASP